MKKLVLTIASLTLCLIMHSAFAADMKIGVIDVNKILADSSQVTDAKNKLKSQFEPREQAIKDAQKKLRSDIEDYNKNSPTMKAAASKTAQQNIMEEQKKLQDLEASFQTDFTTAQNQAMDAILKSIQDAAAKVAASEHYDLIITKMSAAYSSSAMDITGKVSSAMK